ncbi:voltage-dependent T-type calcium channel subunit alpha-1H isoform X3 [Atheta coriaria]|uniref:voltage-dependent T-type calcium channel subunit alpha-1H isoform X3 n=1 Tax=Dalotia coriaria TaxID=877792 RepID=UPI0031F461FC
MHSMHYNTTGYMHCRSDSGLSHRRRDCTDDSADSTPSDLEETESGCSGTVSGLEVDPNLKYPGFAPILYGYIKQTTRPRSWCLALITNPWFERISMIIILLNCITLGMYQPCVDEKCDTKRCQILQVFDDLIFLFFTVEMMIKMMAMGIWGKGTYLADSWNRLDMFIVLAGAVEYCQDIENINLSPIRTIRVLRPLRAINRIPSMRILVMLLLDTLPMLGNVLLLCFFVFFIFGIIGVQLWQGILRQRCYIPKASHNFTFPSNISAPYTVRVPVTDLSLYFSISQEQDFICSKNDHSGMHYCKDIPPYKEGNKTCHLTYEEYMSNQSGCINWHQYYTNCRDGEKNPFQGTISFDNIGVAWVAIFLVISLEGWTDIMYYVQDAHSFWDWIYFVLLIVIGSFFMINLCLVVIATQFSETKKREMERMRMERARFQSSSTLASSTNNSEPTSCYAEIVKYIAHLWRRGKRRIIKKIRLIKDKRKRENERKVISGETIRLNYNKRHHPSCPKLLQHKSDPSLIHQGISGTPTSSIPPKENDNNSRSSNKENKDEDPDSTSISISMGVNQNSKSSNNNELSGVQNSELLTPQPQRRRSSVLFSEVVVYHGGSNPVAASPNSSSNAVNLNVDKKNIMSIEKMTQTGEGNIWQISSTPTPQQMIHTHCFPLTKGETMTCQQLLALGGINAALPTGHGLDLIFSSLSKGSKQSDDDVFFQSLDDYSCCQDMWHCEAEYRNATRSKCYVITCLTIKAVLRFLSTVRRAIKILVEHKYFQQSILVAILINTSSMGIEYHDQPKELTYVVETSNIVFSAIFAVEMLLKVIAEGPFGYVSNGFNVFDGAIVILSAVEIFQKFTGDGQGDSGLSVLRTFRLLRILKLVRFMPNLRRQLFVMLRTMDNVAIFFSLLILFIFIFSILGMNLFGCKFCEKSEKNHDGKCPNNEDEFKDRKNFDSLLWAIVTVFQILTQEDWNMVLSNGMAKTSHWAALYFVALMTFGNYVLFNLLVAILVEGFSSERNERREREQREMARRKMSMMDQSGRESSDESSRSISSSSCNSYHNNQEMRHYSKSAEELRKVKHTNGQQCITDCREFPRECCPLNLEIDPKCNIQKESKMMKNAQVSPPVITHTAATPQDSPSTTLDDFPEFRYSITHISGDTAMSNEICNFPNSSSNNSSKSTSSMPGLLKPPSHLSPPQMIFRPFDAQPADPPTASAKIITHNERIGSKITSYSEKVGPAKSNDKARLQRKTSWKLGSRSSLKVRKKNRSVSDSEAMPLNNGRGQEHDLCNGGGVTRHGSLRNDLLQSSMRIQNDTQTDPPNNRSPRGLSPPNAIRLRSNTQSTSNTMRPNSLLTASQVKLENDANMRLSHKSINEAHEKPDPEKALPVICMEECAEGARLSTSPPANVNRIKRVLNYLEPKGCMKERDDYSLYVFAPANRFRRFCAWFVAQKWFDNVVLLFIALNCITLAMERPNIPPDSPERLFLSTSNYVFTVVFTLEMFVKVVACGMCYGTDAYFTSGWNIMDGSLVIISIVDLLMSLISESSPKIFGILRVFRLLRSLRPLRVINRAPGLKLVVQTLLSSLRPIGNIVLICCTFFIIFGILGVQLFKGSFYSCKGPTAPGVRNRTECEGRGNKWVNQKYNFDDLGKALMSLFVLSSRDGWVNIMYTGLDAVGVDQQPQINYSEWRLLYFISFILLVGFFVLNMFVGVVVENFHRCREEQEKEERVRRAAKRAIQMEKRRRKMNEPPYYINYSPRRLFIHNVVTSKYFDLAIAAVIGLNVVTMATESYKMPEILSYILKIFNYFFTAVFILESTMKLIALGFVLYLKDKWNQLDVVIVILSVVGIILEELKSNIIPINPTVLRVMRVMRIARVLKLLKMAKGIRALLDTVMQALPQVGNLGLLFFLLFFIFAALGVELFGKLKCDDENPCQGLGEHADFSNFGMAFLTLFRVATGDNWNGIMKDTLREGCESDADCVKNCCISPVIAPIFFVIFVLMAQFVLVNVVVAVLMKHLEESHKHLEDEQDMDNQLEREFQEKQEMEERRELCLALQLDSEMLQPNYKPLTKVLSLPSNFIYIPPGAASSINSNNHRSRVPVRRQTVHSQQPIMLSTFDDFKNIDDSQSEIYSKNNENKNLLGLELKVTCSDSILKRSNQGLNENLLPIPKDEHDSSNFRRLYGSTKHLFMKPSSSPPKDVTEETPFLQPESQIKIPKHDSQESVQRIITERRKMDESLKDVNEYDIFDISNGSEEQLVDSEPAERIVPSNSR